MICWALWRTRNDALWNHKRARASNVLFLARAVWNSWSHAQVSVPIQLTEFMTAKDGAFSWNKPHPGDLKINVDAALFPDSASAGIACLARNHDGLLLEARTRIFSGLTNPEIAEAIGVREALSWIKDRNWHHITIETDSLLVVQALRSTIRMDSYFGSIIADCLSILQSLPSVCILFVRRSANMAAHLLARFACSYADRTLYTRDMDPSICSILKNDLLKL